jgi:hypothetical protein
LRLDGEVRDTLRSSTVLGEEARLELREEIRLKRLR